MIMTTSNEWHMSNDAEFACVYIVKWTTAIDSELHLKIMTAFDDNNALFLLVTGANTNDSEPVMYLGLSNDDKRSLSVMKSNVKYWCSVVPNDDKTWQIWRTMSNDYFSAKCRRVERSLVNRCSKTHLGMDGFVCLGCWVPADHCEHLWAHNDDPLPRHSSKCTTWFQLLSERSCVRPSSTPTSPIPLIPLLLSHCNWSEDRDVVWESLATTVLCRYSGQNESNTKKCKQIKGLLVRPLAFSTSCRPKCSICIHLSTV